MTIEEMLKESQANEERLESENASLKKAATTHDTELKAATDRADKAEADLKAEQSAHEETKTELTQAKADLKSEKASMKSVNDTLTAANLTLGTGDNEKPLAEQIKTQASAEAARIVASQGADAPVETGAPSGEKGDKGDTKLEGLDRTKAAFRKQISRD